MMVLIKDIIEPRLRAFKEATGYDYKTDNTK